MKKKTMIILGPILIIIAVMAVTMAEPRFRKAVYQRTIAQTNQMRMEATIMHYGGLGTGVIGAVFLLAGIIKKEN